MNKSKKTSDVLSGKSPILFLSSFVIGIIFALVAYILFFQSPISAKREIAFAILLWLLLTPLVYLVLTRFIEPRLGEYTPRARRNWILISVGVGILFALVTRPPEVILLLPKHDLQITVPAGNAERTITLEYAKTALRDIGFGEFEQQGEWQRTEGGLTHTGAEPALLTWSGRTGEEATFIFSETPSLSDVWIGWDGSLSALDTSKVSYGQVPFSSTFRPSPQSSASARLLIGFTIGFLFLVITLFLAGVQVKAAQPIKQKKGYWLLYTLPMISIWGIYLLTFFPGMMSVDSNSQWNQLITGQFNNAHPVFHTLTMWLITRIWLSPAAVAIFQILALSFTVAWGISILDEQGLPPWGAWGLTSLFALSPVNGDMVIILWKDILYSTSLLLLTLMILKIVFTRGEWLSKKGVWVWLGLVSLCVASFRHNGLPIPILAIPVLILVYKHWWKPLLFAMLLFLGIWLVYKGPVSNLLKVKQSAGSIEQILVHHIAAHIINGKPLSAKQQAVADEIIPRGRWEYNCCTNVTTMDSPGYSDEKNAAISSDIRWLFFDLLFREPGVEFQHQICISSLVWETTNPCPIRSFLPYNTTLGIYSRYSSNDQNSQLPFLVKPLAKNLFLIRDRPILDLIFTPSIYLYLSFFCTFFFGFRVKTISPALFLLPIGIQSITLIIVNLSSAFRYQYGAMLIGLFSFGLLILALCTPKEIQPGLISKTQSRDK